MTTRRRRQASIAPDPEHKKTPPPQPRRVRPSSSSAPDRDATPPVRKLVAFDIEDWRAVDLLGHDSMKSFQELADEAFRDLLRKHGRPDTLRAALRKSVAAGNARSRGRPMNRARSANDQ